MIGICASLVFCEVDAQQPSYSGLGQESVTTELLARYAPKPLDPEFSQEIEREMQIDSGGRSFVVAPDGKKVFYTWAITGNSQVWRLDGPNTFPIQMTGGEDNTSVAGITYDGRTIFLSRDRKGEENPGLFLQKAEGGKITAIHHKPKVQTYLERVSYDRKNIYYSANEIKNDSRALYRYNLATAKSELIYAADGLWSVASEAWDSKTLLLEKSVTNFHSEFYTYSLATKKLTPVLGHNDDESYEVSFGRTEGEFFVRTNKFGDFYRGYIYQSGKFNPVTPDVSFDVESFWRNRTGTRVYFTINEAGYSTLHVLDAKNLKPIATPKLPVAGELHIDSESFDGRYTAFSVLSETELTTRFVYDWKTRKAERWNRGFAPEMDVSGYTKAQLLNYPAQDGTPIPAFVWASPVCKNKVCPVIVDFHGGPEGQSTPGFYPSIQRYLRNGFHYVRPNVRGSTGYGKKWLNSDNGPKRLNVITDIDDAGRFFKKYFSIDNVAPKLGIVGGSYGGYATLVGMTLFAGTYDVGVSIVGISNLITFLNNTAPYRRPLRIAEYGDPVKDEEALKKLSPIFSIEKIQAPLLILQGVNDPRVPAGEALQIQQTLEKRGQTSELVLFPDSGHGAANRKDRVLFSGYTFQYFKKYLK